MRRVAVWATACAATLCAAAAPASATFRGGDGLLAVQPPSGRGIVLVTAQGVVRRRLCGAGAACPGRVSARWSPDGRSLALSSPGGAGQGPEVRLVYPDGSCLDCDPISAGGAAFTPDPSLITVLSAGALVTDGVDGIRRRGSPPGRVSDAVWSSTGELAVVRGGSVWSAPAGPAGLAGRLRRLGRGQAPSWSPNGSRLAMVRAGMIVTERVRGGAARRLARGSAPAWSPDGRSIAFFDPAHRLRMVRLSDHRIRDVGDVRGVAVDWQPLPAAPAPGCIPPPGSRVMARSPGAVITDAGGVAVPFQGFGPTAYMGCIVGDGRERLLARDDFQSEDTQTGATQAAVAGPYGALATFATDLHYGGSSEAVTVYDLRTGTTPADRGGETIGCGDYDYSCFSSLDDLVINSRGDTAAHTTVYGDCADAGPDPCPAERIQVSDGAGIRTVDIAPAVPGQPVLGDLAISDSTLSWSHGPTRETVALR